MLSAKRNAKAAKYFLKKLLNALHTIEPRAIAVDKNAANPPASTALKKDEALPESTKAGQIKGAVMGRISFINQIFGIAS